MMLDELDEKNSHTAPESNRKLLALLGGVVVGSVLIFGSFFINRLLQGLSIRLFLLLVILSLLFTIDLINGSKPRWFFITACTVLSLWVAISIDILEMLHILREGSNSPWHVYYWQGYIRFLKLLLTAPIDYLKMHDAMFNISAYFWYPAVGCAILFFIEVLDEQG